jgi:hypothetical protein
MGVEKGGQGGDRTTEILKDILIVQLGLARVPQQRIQKIVGCSINRVNEIVKHLKPAKNAKGNQ